MALGRDLSSLSGHIQFQGLKGWEPLRLTGFTLTLKAAKTPSPLYSPMENITSCGSRTEGGGG